MGRCSCRATPAGRDAQLSDYFTRATWFSLPLRLRTQWWRDTDYGRLPPSLKMCETLARECGYVVMGSYRED